MNQVVIGDRAYTLEELHRAFLIEEQRSRSAQDSEMVLAERVAELEAEIKKVCQERGEANERALIAEEAAEKLAARVAELEKPPVVPVPFSTMSRNSQKEPTRCVGCGCRAADHNLYSSLGECQECDCCAYIDPEDEP